MKKLFLLIPALVLSLITNAAVINITPTSPYDTHDNLRLALYYANPGDEIVLTDGTYDEHDNYLYFDKDITVRAADGASPVIDMYTYAQIKNSANVRIEGLKFNGAAQGSYSYYIRFYDNSNTNLELDGCEFYSVKNYVLYGNSSSHTNSLIVNNCYFHNNVKNTIYFEASGTEGVQTCNRLEVRNSTIANTDALTNYTSTIDIRPYGSDVTNAIKVIIDHCTFYNNPTINSDHSAIRPYKLSDVTISNCIFAHPEAYERRATCCYGGTISNCLTFNLTTDASQNAHRQSGGLPVFSGNFTADPLFTDAANGDFSLAGNWVTMSLSTACGAATDGSDLGDPRWYTDPVLPSTDFASPYVFLGTKAQLSGSFALNGDNFIQSDGTTTDGLAVWKIEVTRKCVVDVTLNIDAANGSGHRYELALYDEDNNLVGTALAEPENSWSKGDKVMGTFEIPAAGNYTIKLTNDCDYSSTIIEGVTFAYVGGAVVPVSPTVNTTLNIADALFSGCSRDAIGIAYPSSGTSSAWIKWNISTSATAFYDITVNINTAYAHGFTVAVFEDENAEPVASVTEGSYINTTGDGLALELGNISLAGGKNYVVKVTNAPSGSQAKVLNVTFAPVASSSAITLPNTLDFNDAILFGTAFVNEDKLYFAEHGKESQIHEDITGAWAVWNVTVKTAGTFLFTLNASSTNGQSYKISIMDGETEIDSYLKNPGEGEVEMKHYFYLEPGNYSVKVQNKTQWSHGYLTGLVVTQPDDIIVLSENATDNSAWVDKVNDGNSYKVQIMRSFARGMYNTICLPIYVSGSEARKVFGEDVVLKVLDGANLDDTESILELNFKTSSDIWQGTPHLIKPSKNIVNPVFENVQFMASAPSPTTKDQANFVGTFVATNIPAGEENLFLGRNDLLYFNKSAATPVGGFRAWFVLHDIPDGPHFIKGARIVERENTTTGMENVDQLPKANSQKLIENGMLIIIRDGVRYNVMGVRVE